MATTIGRAVLELATDLSDFTTKDASKQLSDLTGLSKESMTALAQGGALALGAVTALAAGIVALGVRGAVVEDVRSSFASLSADAGATADVMLGALRKGTAGTISDFELMKLANKAMGAGLVATAGDFETLSAGARLLAKRTGEDTSTAFDKLTSAMASGRTAQLKQLGLFVDSKAAVEAYGKATGLSVSEMTDADRATALQTQTLIALRKELATNSSGMADFGERIEQGKVMFQNFTDGLSVAIATSPVVTAGMNAIGAAMESAFGGDQSALIKKLTGYVNDFAIGVTYGADTLIFFGQRGNEVMTMLEVVIAGVGVGVTYLAEKIAGSLEGILVVAEKIPGLGEKFTPARQAMENTRTVLNGMRLDYQAQVGEAIDGGARNAAALDAVSGAVQTTRNAMIAAKNAQTSLTGATDAGTASIRLAIPAVEELTQAQIKAAEAAEKKATEYRAYLNWIGERRMEDEARVLADLTRQDTEYRAYQNWLGERRMEQDAIMNQTIADRAAALGFLTRSELEATAEAALLTYQAMQESGEFTAATLEEAWAKYEAARRAAQDDNQKNWATSNEVLLSSTASMLGQLGQKYKAAAIAGAIISTYQAIAKSMASLPWPSNLISAAGAAAAGWANVAKIRSSEAGFRTGTPALDFMGFDPMGEPINVHGDEAIIPRGGGHELAGEIATSMGDGSFGGGPSLDLVPLRNEIVGLRRDLRITLPELTATAARHAVLAAGRVR